MKGAMSIKLFLFWVYFCADGSIAFEDWELYEVRDAYRKCALLECPRAAIKWGAIECRINPA